MLDKNQPLRHAIGMTKRLLPQLLKWSVSLGMLAYALHSIELEKIVQMLVEQNPIIPLAVIFIMMFQMVISTFRWQRIVYLLTHKTEHPPLGQLCNLNFISAFFNSCLPGTIGGDVVRAMLLKSERLPLSTCAHSVIIDRLMAVVGIFAMVVLSLPWLGRLLPLPVPLLVALSIIACIIGLLFLRKAPAWLRKLPDSPMVRMTASLTESMGRIVFAPMDFLIMLAQAIAAHACFCLSAYLLGLSLGVPFGLWDAMLLVPPVLLMMLLPISVGGWGVREVSMVGMLALIHIPKEAALTISVQMGILLIIASLPGAWCYARYRKFKAPIIPA